MKTFIEVVLTNGKTVSIRMNHIVYVKKTSGGKTEVYCVGPITPIGLLVNMKYTEFMSLLEQ